MMSLPVYKANDFIGQACSFTDRILRTPKWFQIFFFAARKFCPGVQATIITHEIIFYTFCTWCETAFTQAKERWCGKVLERGFVTCLWLSSNSWVGEFQHLEVMTNFWAHRVWQLSRTVGIHCPVWSLLKRALGEVQSKGKRHFILPVIYRVWWAHLVFNVQWFNGKKVKRRIASELQLAKYFSISTDLTPYISHTELPADIYFQMSRWWRHNSGAIVGFEPVYSHTGASLADGVVKMTSDLELDLSNCRGQSYDNASNMSSQYNGCHAHLKKINPLIHYVQYDAHSLNILNTW